MVCTPTSSVSAGMFSFGAWTFDSDSMQNPVVTVGKPAIDETREHGQRPARADEQRSGASVTLERVRGEADHRRVRVRVPGRAALRNDDLDLRTGRRGLAHEALEDGPDRRRDPVRARA